MSTPILRRPGACSKLRRAFPLPLRRSFSIPRVRTSRRLRVLTPREARVVEALADTVFPSVDTGMPSVAEAEVVEYFDDLLTHLPFKERLLIRSLLLLLEVQSLAFNGTSPRFFTQATPRQRELNLKGWESSRFFQRRVVFMAIRTLLLWAYVDSQEAERDMGVVGGTRAMSRRNLARARSKMALSELSTDIPRDPVPTPHPASAPASTGSFGPSPSSTQETAEKHA